MKNVCYHNSIQTKTTVIILLLSISFNCRHKTCSGSTMALESFKIHRMSLIHHRRPTSSSEGEPSHLTPPPSVLSPDLWPLSLRQSSVCLSGPSAPRLITTWTFLWLKPASAGLRASVYITVYFHLATEEEMWLHNMSELPCAVTRGSGDNGGVHPQAADALGRICDVKNLITRSPLKLLWCHAFISVFPSISQSKMQICHKMFLMFVTHSKIFHACDLLIFDRFTLILNSQTSGLISCFLLKCSYWNNTCV